MWLSPDTEVTFHTTTSFSRRHVILKTITRTRTLKGGGFGLTLALPFIAHFQLGSHKQYGITPLPLWTNLVGILQP